MHFEIFGKVALITGGASGLGLSFGKDLLQHKLRALVIVDLNGDTGKEVCQNLNAIFGEGRVIFIQSDVTDIKQFEEAFKQTVKQFGHIDILINNAGILNDKLWQRELQININGTVNGIILGMENYLQKHRSGSEAVIVNVCSVAGVGGKMNFPATLYTCSKFAVHGLTISFGCKEHFDRTKVRVVAVCPGVTNTPLVDSIDNKTLGDPYEKLVHEYVRIHSIQEPEDCAKAVTDIIRRAETGTLWISEGGEKPYQYTIPNRFQIPKIYLKESS